MPNMDREIGKDAVRHFHNEALNFSENYSLKYEELVKYIDTKNPTFFVDFGGSIRVTKISSTKVESAMKNLAQSGKGLFPKFWAGWFDALNDKLKMSFGEAVVLSSKDAVKDLAAAGKVVEKTFQNAGGLVTLVPLLLFLGLGFYIYERAK